MSSSIHRGRPAPSPRDAAFYGLVDRRAAAGLAGGWWILALRGVLGIVLGIAALAAPVAVMPSLAPLFAAYCLIDGVLAIASAVAAARHGAPWGFLALEGAVDVAVAAVAVLFPAGTMLGFVVLVAAWALLTGGTMVAAACRVGRDRGRWLFALAGAISMAWGAIVILAPLVGAPALTWWLGGYALAFGVVLLIFALRLRLLRPAPPEVVADD